MTEKLIPFARHMERALYGPDGYYSAGIARTGRNGDYFTAPETGPVFGRVLSALFSSWHPRITSGELTLIEAGAGEGTLAQSMLAHLAAGVRMIAVERSAARRARLRMIARSSGGRLAIRYGLAPLARSPVDGILFANELIDAFPVHRVRRRAGKLEEAYVGGPARLSWGKPSTPALVAYFKRLGLVLPEGYETEVNLAMALWIRQAAAALARGLVVLIDYGRPAEAYYAPERDQGTLRGFSKHRVDEVRLGAPAGGDITADVDFTSLALDGIAAGLRPVAFLELGSFLMLGLRAMSADLGASDSPLRARPTALRYLLHPEGLGAAFHVLVLAKNLEGWTFEHNRLARLGLERIPG